ncbi:hypothetical protein [Streptosporangium sp. NPDC049078]|uniref:hypothetical protein n=1 Tax=Streptosporangium sp. NPDC049078 TaxID=3155767 RepID=UPI003438D5DA
MIGAAILCASIALTGSGLAITAANSRRWIHATTAAACSALAAFAATWFLLTSGTVTVWPVDPGAWLLLGALWLAAAAALGLIFWGIGQERRATR